MEDKIFAIDRELRALKELGQLTAADAFCRVHTIIRMVNEVVSLLSLVEDSEQVAGLYRKAERAYLIAAEKVPPGERDQLVLFSTYWLTMAYQAERHMRPWVEKIAPPEPIHEKEPIELYLYPQYREIMQLAWRSFTTKLAVVVAFASALVLLIICLFVPGIGPDWRIPAIAFSSVALAGLSLFTLTRANVAGFREREKLREELAIAWEQVKELNDAKRAWFEAEEGTRVKTPQLLYDFSSRYYGLTQEKYYVDGELSENGGLDCRFSIKLVATTSEVSSIEYFAEVSHPPRAPELPLQVIVEGKEEPDLDLRTKVQQYRVNHNSLLCKFVFDPPISPYRPEEYSFIQRLPPGAFAMTLEELRESDLEFEYYYQRPNYPTKEVRLRVALPKGFEPTSTSYDVWLGKNQARHANEYIRIKKEGFWNRRRERDCLCLELKIKYPIPELYYVIKWVPPPSK